MRALLALGVLVLGTGLAPAKSSPWKQRCGWLDNVTPGNFELIDREGAWTIAQQGGYEAQGFETMPDMSARDWVETNGPHGHGCACMDTVVDRKTMQVVRLRGARPVPVARCKRDRALKGY